MPPLGVVLEIVAPTGLSVSRLVVVGVGKARELESKDLVKLGGIVMGRIPAAESIATVVADLPGGRLAPEQVADFALGMRLRAYAFDRYKTKRKEGDEKAAEIAVAIAVAGVGAVEKAFRARAAVADEPLLELARTLGREQLAWSAGVAR